MEPALDWSDWTPLESFEETEDPRLQETGVYQVRIVRDGEPVTIPRWLGEDPGGLVYVGCAWKGTIKTRLRRLHAGINRHTVGHTAGKKRCLLRRHLPAYEERFGGLTRECRWVQTEGGEVARRIEDDVIHTYVAKFGEAPPLNSDFPYRTKPEVWEQRFGDG